MISAYFIRQGRLLQASCVSVSKNGDAASPLNDLGSRILRNYRERPDVLQAAFDKQAAGTNN
jgi:hypothetical protein